MKDVADGIRAEVARAASVFRGWSEADASRERGPDKWVRKEILGHLIDSALNNHERVVRAQLADRFVWPSYEQQQWVAVEAYRQRSWAELIDLWVALNRHFAATVELLPADKRRTPCVIGDNPEEPLESVVRDYLRHMRHHLEQIERG